MTKSNWIFAGATTLALFIALALSFIMGGSSVQAQPLIPHTFYGNVTTEGGLPAAPGLTIHARINNVNYASVSTGGGVVPARTETDGKYGQTTIFTVCGDTHGAPGIQGGVDGDIIEFYVSNIRAQAKDEFGNTVDPVLFQSDETKYIDLVYDPSGPAVVAKPSADACMAGDQPPTPTATTRPFVPPGPGPGPAPTATPEPPPPSGPPEPTPTPITGAGIVSGGAAAGAGLAELAETDPEAAAVALAEAFAEDPEAAAAALNAAAELDAEAAGAMLSAAAEENVEAAGDMLAATAGENAEAAGAMLAAAAGTNSTTAGEMLARAAETDADASGEALAAAAETDSVATGEALAKAAATNADATGDALATAAATNAEATGDAMATSAQRDPEATGTALVRSVKKNATATSNALKSSAKTNAGATGNAMAAGPARDPEALAALGVAMSVEPWVPEDAPDWPEVGSPAPIEKILARLAAIIPSARVAVADVLELPAGVPSLPAARIVSNYLTISPENFGDEDVVAGHATMFVEKSWLDANQIHQWSIQFSRFDEGSNEWSPSTAKRVREDQQRVYYSVLIPGFSMWAISGSVDVPAVDFRVDDLTISPTQAVAGQTVVIRVRVTNLTGEPGEYNTSLWLNATPEDSEGVMVNPGATETVTFLLQPEVGSYDVRIGRLLGSFTVQVAPPTATPAPTRTPRPTATPRPVVATPTAMPTVVVPVLPTAPPSAPPTPRPTIIPTAIRTATVAVPPTPVPAKPTPTTPPVIVAPPPSPVPTATTRPVATPTIAPTPTPVPEVVPEEGIGAGLLILIIVLVLLIIGGAAIVVYSYLVQQGNLPPPPPPLDGAVATVGSYLEKLTRRTPTEPTEPEAPEEVAPEPDDGPEPEVTEPPEETAPEVETPEEPAPEPETPPSEEAEAEEPTVQEGGAEREEEKPSGDESDTEEENR